MTFETIASNCSIIAAIINTHENAMSASQNNAIIKTFPLGASSRPSPQHTQNLLCIYYIIWTVGILQSEIFLVSIKPTSCCSRQIQKLTDQRVQQSISSGQKVEKVRQEGEMKMLQMKQQLKEEQAKSKQKADEITALRRYVCYE